MQQYTVYIRTNRTNGKSYVGITSTTIEERWQNDLERIDEYRSLMARKGHTSHKKLQPGMLYGDIVEHGTDAFVHAIISIHDSLFLALVQERRQIALHNTNCRRGGHGYNLSDGGDIWTMGQVFSIEQIIPLLDEARCYLDDPTLPIPTV